MLLYGILANGGFFQIAYGHDLSLNSCMQLSMPCLPES
jgi:hypothetical protein